MLAILLAASLIALLAHSAVIAAPDASVLSPDGRNRLELSHDRLGVYYSVIRNDQVLFGPSPIRPVLAGNGQVEAGKIDGACRVVSIRNGTIDEQFPLYWGKTKQVANRCSYAVVTLANGTDLRWQLELRAYDDGVAFRYRLLRQKNLVTFSLREEETEFRPGGEPIALFNTLVNFTTSHESLYHLQPLTAIPTAKLLDCPVLFLWPKGPAAAITEARVQVFAGMYLQRRSSDDVTLTCRLSPLPGRDDVAVTGTTPHESPWRVVLLADVAGKLVESNLLLCLNDPPAGDFSWARPGKTTFHWWYGEFEDDYKLPSERETYVARHKRYIDFCAENNIAYHSISGDGLAWYKQSPIDYGTAAADADVRVARPELGLPDILAYARQRGVGIRLWVHWKPLSRQLEEAMSVYQSWGIKGLMVDFLNRDDQEMVQFTQRLLESAARHKIHIQIHGSSKFSGEQRTFPNLFNREGVLNLEYVKWSDYCTPQHSVNVAYTRALAGPVDFHLGGFRSVGRATFKPRDRAPLVMGTRCHNLALYVVFENPMPMVADAPESYAGQVGFEFIRDVPTTWDETRFLAGEPGEYFVIARRSGKDWFIGGITNWTPRTVSLPLNFLGAGKYQLTHWIDGSQDESLPNEIRKRHRQVDANGSLSIQMAPGGGSVALLRPTD